jgi:hypothetical protein
MEAFGNMFSNFLNIGMSFWNSTSKLAMDMYQMDTMSKMGQLKVDALLSAADAQMEQAELQAKEYEIERQASAVQASQTYAQRMAEYSEATAFNSFVRESLLGGGESMSVNAFVKRQAKMVAEDSNRINSQAIAVDSALAREGHMSLLRGINAARATRNQALQTAYQNTIDLLQVSDPISTGIGIFDDVKKIATTIRDYRNK